MKVSSVVQLSDLSESTGLSGKTPHISSFVHFPPMVHKPPNLLRAVDIYCPYFEAHLPFGLTLVEGRGHLMLELPFYHIGFGLFV
jgi:hypothetical protein